MEAPYILISTISPEKGKKIDAFDKHTKYVSKVFAPTDFSKTLFEYAEYFFEAAHKITEFILSAEHPDIGKLDTYFFSIAFLYRHCMELGLKAIGFQSIQEKDQRKKFVKDTRHNLSVILSVIEEKASSTRPEEEMEWLRKYFTDLSQKDRESDSFRYPFHIVWEPGDWECEGKFSIKKIFNEQTDLGNSDYNERLFLPMCYLYRNCVELSLKTIWFEEIGEDFQTKCKLMLDNKHSIAGMWKKIKPYVLEYSSGTDEPAYIEVIEDYCMQVHTIDGDANKFRYPMSNGMQEYFSLNKRFDFMETGDFFEALNNILDGIDSELNYMNEVRAEMEAEYRAEMEAEYYAEMMSNMDYY